MRKQFCCTRIFSPYHKELGISNFTSIAIYLKQYKNRDDVEHFPTFPETMTLTIFSIIIFFHILDKFPSLSIVIFSFYL